VALVNQMGYYGLRLVHFAAIVAANGRTGKTMGHFHQQPGALLPPGLVAAKSWLLGKSVQRHTVDNWLKSGQIVAVTRGVFKRPEAELTWQGVACSLQRMGADLTPGGLTALELQGFNHYLSMGPQSVVHLYGRSHLPRWVNHLLPETSFERHGPLEFDSREDDSGFENSRLRTQVMPVTLRDIWRKVLRIKWRNSDHSAKSPGANEALFVSAYAK